MKKLLFLSLAAAISFSAIAHDDQHDKGKNKKQQHGKKYKKDKKNHDDRNGEWRNDDDRREDDSRYDNRRNDGSWNDQNNNQRNNQNAGNAPRKVRDAFYRDYPNASNVRWTKDRGVWTANFRSAGLFSGNRSVSYRANGERVGNNTWANRQTTDRNNRTTDRNNTPQKNTNIFDKVLRRNN
jgi:hypothetical protein